MKRSQRLKVVLEIAQRNEATALKKMQAIKQQVEQEVQRLKEFVGYRADYEKKLAEAAAIRISTTQYVNYQRFIAQLGTVIEQQQQKIQWIEQQLEKAMGEWRLAHEKTRGMGDHIADCRDAEQREADAKEQRALDEISQMRRAFKSRD